MVDIFFEVLKAHLSNSLKQTGGNCLKVTGYNPIPIRPQREIKHRCAPRSLTKFFAMTKMVTRLLILLTILPFGGCQSSGVVEVSDNVYKISLKSAGGMFADEVKMRSEVVSQANNFAASKGKVAVEITTHSDRPIALGLPKVEYVFKLADKVSGEASNQKPKDYYDEIVRLDDLRKKGLITDAEYEAQKTKILSVTK